MDKKFISLTSEELKSRYKNNFDLVNYAIKLAENMIKSGRGPRIKSDLQNKALLVLGEIEQGKDTFDLLPEEEVAKEYEFNNTDLKARFGKDEKYSREEKHTNSHKHKFKDYDE